MALWCVREIRNEFANLFRHEYGWRGLKQVLCSATDGVQDLHIYDVCLAYSFVIPPFVRLLFVQIGMCFVPLVLCS